MMFMAYSTISETDNKLSRLGNYIPLWPSNLHNQMHGWLRYLSKVAHLEKNLTYMFYDYNCWFVFLFQFHFSVVHFVFQIDKIGESITAQHGTLCLVWTKEPCRLRYGWWSPTLRPPTQPVLANKWTAPKNMHPGNIFPRTRNLPGVLPDRSRHRSTACMHR